MINANIRWMKLLDMGDVLQIEARSFEFPWHDDDFAHCLRCRSTIGMVAELNGRCLGFMIYELLPDRLDILNFAVEPMFRRQGVGRRFIETLISKLEAGKRSRITCLIREANLGGQLFFRELGFRAIGIVRSPFVETSEDAYRLEYRLSRAAWRGEVARVAR